jgi:hypothetical protein
VVLALNLALESLVLQEQLRKVLQAETVTPGEELVAVAQAQLE